LVIAPKDGDLSSLLGRAEIQVDIEAATAKLRGRTVLVTGAAGAIGTEICRQVSEADPATLVAIDRSENQLCRLEHALLARRPTLQLVPLLVDVLDAPAMRAATRRWRPAIVFHAAAYKHVPVLERHPAEGVRNNVGGTLSIARAAQAAGVERFLFISTDKAVRPVSVLGASKRAAEILLQCLAGAARGRTAFITVRFGNIIDSGGNVVERFRTQIAQGGPVTVTHPEMRRYFMSAAEAVRLVLQASVVGANGDVLLLNLGPPVGILELAQRLIREAAPAGGGDIRILVGQPRPGDKLREDYELDGHPLLPSPSPHILRAALPSVDAKHVRPMIDRLLELARRRADAAVVDQLARIVPDYQPAAADA
jgi:FlaA1/EpsC-like NDP-sugar epimerase